MSKEGIHTNGVENVWSLFKRGVVGVFHKVSEKYLPLYLDEFAFRFNNRNVDMMVLLLKRAS
jgi:transposase-like protein